ncbi:hypothetical protein C8R43DRAFT_995283 [Mycena crocata]|nr:hypothetical protein C8R43DRAFT_995283 [Mycena crocata]
MILPSTHGEGMIAVQETFSSLQALINSLYALIPAWENIWRPVLIVWVVALIVLPPLVAVEIVAWKRIKVDAMIRSIHDEFGDVLTKENRDTIANARRVTKAIHQVRISTWRDLGVLSYVKWAALKGVYIFVSQWRLLGKEQCKLKVRSFVQVRAEHSDVLGRPS